MGCLDSPIGILVFIRFAYSIGCATNQRHVLRCRRWVLAMFRLGALMLVQSSNLTQFQRRGTVPVSSRSIITAKSWSPQRTEAVAADAAHYWTSIELPIQLDGVPTLHKAFCDLPIYLKGCPIRDIPVAGAWNVQRVKQATLRTKFLQKACKSSIAIVMSGA